MGIYRVFLSRRVCRLALTCPVLLIRQASLRARGPFLAQDLTAVLCVLQEERQTVVEHACPGPGACGGMYTANTMASAIEVRQRSIR